MTEQIALFPLHTVLFPGGVLPLKIFEARYVDLIGRCLRDDSPFGVCLIRRGSEVGAVADFFPFGTSARIADWERRPDGLLGITVCGERRFRVLGSAADPHRLLWADVEWCDQRQCSPPEEGPDLDALREWLIAMLKSRPGPDEVGETELRDSDWLSYRLAELLPDPADRQALLQMDSGRERLVHLRALLQGRSAP